MSTSNDVSEHVDEGAGIDERWLLELRLAYRDYPQHDALLLKVASGYPRHSRLPGRRGVGTALAGLAAAAAVGIAFTAVRAGYHDDEGLAVAKDSRIASGPTAGAPDGGTQGGSGELQGVADGGAAAALQEDLYKLLDAEPGLGQWMLDVAASNKSARLLDFADVPAALRASLERAASAAGYSFAEERLPDPTTWSEADQRRLSAAAEDVRRELSAGASRLAALHIETPLGRIVVWATDAASVEGRLQAIATEHGVGIEVHDAPVSQTDAEALGEELRSENATWEKQGFTVNGAYATGSGAVVVVRGDRAAALAALGKDDRVLAVELDDGKDLVGRAG